MSEDYNKLFRNGELPYGLYYCRKGDETRTLQGEGDSLEEEIFYTGEYVFWHNSDPDVEILDSVPTFEEWEQLQNWARFTDDYHALREQKEIAEYEIAGLKSELKEVCDVLIRKCPEMKEWVMLNWRKLYDCDKS